MGALPVTAFPALLWERGCKPRLEGTCGAYNVAYHPRSPEKIGNSEEKVGSHGETGLEFRNLWAKSPKFVNCFSFRLHEFNWCFCQRFVKKMFGLQLPNRGVFQYFYHLKISFQLTWEVVTPVVQNVMNVSISLVGLNWFCG